MLYDKICKKESALCKLRKKCRQNMKFVSDVEVDIILPVVLYGCKTWSLTLREERRLRVFEIGC